MPRLFLPGLLSALTALPCLGAGDDWMKGVADQTPLSRLSIPGTHDTGARYEPVGGTTQCQTLTIPEQLQAGVRFLDIRCRHLKDGFAIYHGAVDQKLSFDEVIDAAAAFLKAHPSETIVMSAKEESKAENDTRSFEATFQTYLAKRPELWYLNPALPALGAARGKIVLFRRFPAKEIRGIDASAWPDSTTFSSGVLRVQDAYKVAANDQKWAAVSQLLAESASGKPETLHVNFTSGYSSGALGIPSIPSVSKDLNRRLTAWLGEHPKDCTGILVMDFVTVDQCEAVYRHNLDQEKAGR